jgi:hypothetical protein
MSTGSNQDAAKTATVVKGSEGQSTASAPAADSGGGGFGYFMAGDTMMKSAMEIPAGIDRRAALKQEAHNVKAAGAARARAKTADAHSQIQALLGAQAVAGVSASSSESARRAVARAARAGDNAATLERGAAKRAAKALKMQGGSLLGDSLGFGFGAVGTALGGYFGGPMGAMAGSQVGTTVGRTAGRYV